MSLADDLTVQGLCVRITSMAGLIRLEPVFQRASRGPPHFSSRPTDRTISKSGPLLKLNLRRFGPVQKQLWILGQTHPHPGPPHRMGERESFSVGRRIQPLWKLLETGRLFPLPSDGRESG